MVPPQVPDELARYILAALAERRAAAGLAKSRELLELGTQVAFLQFPEFRAEFSLELLIAVGFELGVLVERARTGSLLDEAARGADTLEVAQAIIQGDGLEAATSRANALALAREFPQHAKVVPIRPR
ncbi:MAG: hypothetical protein U1E28_21955 [Beijerinckiaceae bacterium]